MTTTLPGVCPAPLARQKGILLYHRREAKSPSLAKGWTRSGRGSGKYVPAGQWTPTWYHPRNLPIPWDPGVGMTILSYVVACGVSNGTMGEPLLCNLLAWIISQKRVKNLRCIYIKRLAWGGSFFL